MRRGSLVLPTLACDFGIADDRHGGGCIGHTQNVFLDGSLQFSNGMPPVRSLLINSTGTQIADFVLKATSWHSAAPVAKDLLVRC